MFQSNWQNIDVNDFRIFIRDLSIDINTNLKHNIEDLDKKIETSKKKSKHKKKKDIIIENQEKIRHRKNIDDDTKMIEYIFKHIDEDNVYSNFEKLKTNEGKQQFKFKILQFFIKLQKKGKKDYLKHILNLYYNLKNDNQYLIKNEEYLKMIEKLDKKFNEYDCKSYMLKEMGNLLSPLNFWDKSGFNFEDWQLTTISHIRENKSIIIRAPTSSGKSLIAMSAGIIHNRILYVCPAKPVAYQVGANFIKMGFKVHFLIDNINNYSYDKNTRVFIGTPDIIEHSLPTLNIHYDYCVFDEIHNIDDYNYGKKYENIIKLISSNFIALSATIESIDILKNFFTKIHPTKKIEYIEYNKRFINQQKYTYLNNKLKKVHPITCYNKDNPELIYNIPFTPNDCYTLYEKMYETFEDDAEEIIDNLDPDTYFKDDKLLTLDDSKNYENFIKKEFIHLQKNYDSKTDKIIQSFEINDTPIDNDLTNIIPFFKECEKKNMFPLLYFHTQEDKSKEIFTYIYNELHNKEKAEWPFYYEILEKKNEFYKDYLKKRKIYEESIKIKTKDAVSEKQSKMKEYDSNQKSKFIENICNMYQQYLNKDITKNVSKNLRREMKEFIHNPDFREQDIYKKHPDYCFVSGEPMSGDEIKSIRKEIKKSSGITIEYENPIFQLLKRGIGIYVNSMPDSYNWILQKLLSQKKLAIVISDRTLCLGIDLPIRSVALSGYKEPNYTISDILQMAGRAGRRGHDTEGNIIFHNIQNFKDLLTGELPKLKGSISSTNISYNVIQNFHKVNLENLEWSLNNNSQSLIRKNINHERKGNLLLWSLRNYKNSETIITSLNQWENQLKDIPNDDRKRYLYDKLCEYYQINNKDEIYISIYQNKYNYEIHKDEYINLGELLRNLSNYLDNRYQLCKIHSTELFEKFKILLNKQQTEL